MEIAENRDEVVCPSPEISAYLDGELWPEAELMLETHLAGCRTCAEDLNLQKGFLNALDFSLEEDDQIDLPDNFTKSVVTNVESRVTGLRQRKERHNAALIVLTLVFFSFFALGSSAERTFATSVSVAEKLLAVVAAAGHFVYDLALGCSIVLRSLMSGLLFGSATGGFVFVLILIVSLWFFSRLLVRFDRT